MYGTPTELGVTIGGIVTSLREGQGLSKHKLSDLAGVARSTITNIENGCPPTVTNLDCILKVFELTWEDFGKMIDEASP